MESEEFPFGHAKSEMYRRPPSGNAQCRLGAIASVKGRGEVWARQKNQECICVELVFKGVGMPETTPGGRADGRDGRTIQRSGR